MFHSNHHDSIEALCDSIRANSKIRIVGGRSKLTPCETTQRSKELDVSKLSGILEYDPSEFTLTSLGGTPVIEVQRSLAEHGQHLPFDPCRVEAGATMGGMTAAGITGSSRLRFGGIRDFILGVQLIDGNGNRITGGGKVVKNAAGFDLPKLMVGSWGRLGLLVQTTYKVFPQPIEYRTIRIGCQDLRDALQVQSKLARSPLEIDALDLEPPSTLLVRVGGNTKSVHSASERILSIAERPGEIISGAEEEIAWRSIREWSWHEPDQGLIRVPLSPNRLEAFDRFVEMKGAKRRYGVAGNVAWIGWPTHEPIALLVDYLRSANLNGRVLRGLEGDARLGQDRAIVFGQRVQQALDPASRF